MVKDDLQVENGNFTRIVNPLLERLIQIPFRGCELAVAIFIIRKTYGYQKTEDSLSLSQICKGVNRSKPTVIVALKNLQLVNIAILAKKGNVKGQSNIWRINKYYDTWNLVKTAYLVTRIRGASKDGITKPSKDGITYKRKKENTKEILLLSKKKDNESIPLTVKKETMDYEDNIEMGETGLPIIRWKKGIRRSKILPELTTADKITATPYKEKGFNYEKELEKLKSGSKTSRIIAFYFEFKNFTFENEEQMNQACQRCLKAANKLQAYKPYQVKEVMEHCEKKFEMWTLETVLTRAPDIINKVHV